MGEPVNHPDGAEGDNHGNNAAHPSLHGNRGETDMHADLPVSRGNIVKEKLFFRLLLNILVHDLLFTQDARDGRMLSLFNDR